jgi:cbb3-type cytochrome oxidase maturation protein
MSIIYILIPIAILFTSLAIYLFLWAVKTEQFEDLEKQGMSILFDDDQQETLTIIEKSPNAIPNNPSANNQAPNNQVSSNAINNDPKA